MINDDEDAAVEEHVFIVGRADEEVKATRQSVSQGTSKGGGSSEGTAYRDAQQK